MTGRNPSIQVRDTHVQEIIDLYTVQADTYELEAQNIELYNPLAAVAKRRWAKLIRQRIAALAEYAREEEQHEREENTRRLKAAQRLSRQNSSSLSPGPGDESG